MKDIVENYKTGGSVKDLAKYYKSCVALASLLSEDVFSDRCWFMSNISCDKHR